jgi:pepF/M3 family oligoendopeptidase
MNGEWSLDVLYNSFEDEKYQSDLKKARELVAAFGQTAAGLAGKDTACAIRELLLTEENMMRTLADLIIYTSLRQSANTADAQAANYMDQLQMLASSTSKEEAACKKFIASVDNLEELIEQDDFLKEYKYLLLETKKESRYLLGDDVEDVIARLDISGGMAWSNLQSYLTSSVEVDLNGEKITLSEVRNLAYSPDAKVRREAYEAELLAYEKIKDAVCFSLNSIKCQVNTVAELRGYDSPLDMTLKQAKMKRETLDAMLSAMKEYLPKFHAYLRKKAELLGYENGLPWYELFAPMGDLGRKFTAEEAREYLISHFAPFSQELSDMINQAFEEKWIDFYPRKGKVGGAFCCNMPNQKQSRILTNFDGALGDVVTLAHELGHAFHGKQIENHRPLNTDYSMPVAETASTFNENVVMNAAIDEAEGKEKMILLESQLQDTTQIICDIYSRYLFETAVFEKRKNSFMFADELKELMLEAQKEAYGDGLDHSALHPYMWVCKGHYYDSGLSFYNFPYAFGGLFAGGLYAQYLEEGPSFVDKYKALLKATTVSSVEDVAAMAGIDLTKEDFWKKSLSLISARIDTFLAYKG